MYSDLSFMIAMNGAPYPVQFEADVLEEFAREHADTIDGEVRKFSDKWFGPTHFLDHQNRLGVVAQLIRDAIAEENGTSVAKYVLWMAARYPEISGIRIDQDTYEFTASIFDETTPEGCSVH
ncbi:hypothetical protein [Terasakiella sp. SH-1]|uniref:hypothetical protein n=1 Tax=Terasakiella sp. SH-1 TaxID=2560057 RepID=UPI001073620B|nr:hypothetical protein [Terasakiella sp. SH-1]